MDIYQSVFECAPDPILFVDGEGNILRINAEAAAVFGYAEGELIGRKIETLIPDRFTGPHTRHRDGFMRNPHTRPMGTAPELYAKRKDGSEFPVDVMLSTAATPRGPIAIAILRNVSERKKAEARTAELIQSLRDSLGEVKVLRGLLPICSHCKNIRDDKGFWLKLEDYFRSHADVDFSHGICPACMATFYPELESLRGDRAAGTSS